MLEDGQKTVQYEYDNSGNLIKKITGIGNTAETSYYRYDGYNRLSEFIDNYSTAEYEYNINGLRESKTVNGIKTRYIYNQENIIGEIFDDNIYTYYRASELIGYTNNKGDRYYYRQNSHGDVTALLTIDGQEKKTYSYNAYGKETPFSLAPMGSQTVVQLWKAETEQIHNPFRYCGEYQDSETGLIYLRNRYYDNSIGRFITEDPIRDGLNWYAYCGNNPVMFVDPRGLDAIIITNENSVSLGPAGSLGHTSAIYQNDEGHWFYTYWGAEAAAVIRIPDTYTKWLRDGDITANSMASLSDFNSVLNTFLWENGFEKITTNYTHATYVVGDFSESLTAAYNDVYNAYKKSDGTIKSFDNGSAVYQGYNKHYFFAANNCFDRTYASLSKGTLVDGTNVGTYMKNLGFTGGAVPNENIDNFASIFMNDSFTYKSAYVGLSKYAMLYDQKSPWAKIANKANYAKSAIGR